MKNSSKNKLHIILIIMIILALISSLLFLYLNHNNITLQAVDYTETTDELSNPYIGWYTFYAYTIDDTTSYSTADINDALTNSPDTRLRLLEFNINAYKQSDISDTGLASFKSILETWSHTDNQLILRILYDWDGYGMESEPDTIEQIQRHMTQLGEIINQYSDSVYLMQGIFVGDFAEMHNSAYMTDEGMTTLINTLASATNPSIYLAVRTPSHWRIINERYTPLEESEGFCDSLASRIGLFNDGLLGSGNDFGTYGDTSLANAKTYGDKGTRQEEIAFQNQLCNYVLNGGEIVVDNTYNDFENANHDLANMHASYLNYYVDNSITNKWEASTYEGDGIYQGMNGYDYISRHIGYRYVIRSANITDAKKLLASHHLTITLENVGYSNCYKLMNMSIVLTNPKTSETIRIPIDKDIRYLTALESLNISVALPKDLAKGNYQATLNICDDTTGELLQLANENSNSLGVITVK